MKAQDVVVVLTQPFDPHADPVVKELAARGVEVFRFDTGDFPTEVQMAAHLEGGCWNGSLRSSSGDRRSVDLGQIRSIWYRRPSRFRFSEVMPQDQRQFAQAEAFASLGGVLRSLECLWVSHPDCLSVAAYKPLQLARASVAGFRIPRTILTNDPATARQFYNESEGRVVYKTMGAQQAVGDDGLAQVVFTTVLDDEHLTHFDRIANAPCCFQELIPKARELRITVVGRRVFTVAIEFEDQYDQSGRNVDWRASAQQARYSAFDLPDDVSCKCLSIVHGYGLSFGAIDMIVTPDGEYVFLELNANGQWLWLEEATGLPMTSALIELLVTGDQ